MHPFDLKWNEHKQIGVDINFKTSWYTCTYYISQEEVTIQL